MNPLEKRLLAAAGTFAIGWGVACGQGATPENDQYRVNYAKFTIEVNKTSAHDAYKVINGIIVETSNSGRLASLKFCDSQSQVWIEVPITDTDYFEKDKSIVEEEKKGNVSPSPFYKAKLGDKPCELVRSDGIILQSLGFKR